MNGGDPRMMRAWMRQNGYGYASDRAPSDPRRLRRRLRDKLRTIPSIGLTERIGRAIDAEQIAEARALLWIYEQRHGNGGGT
jgi:hypothetical protein